MPGADGLFMVVDERGVFKDDSFQAAVAALQDGNAAAATAQSGNGGGKGDKKAPKQVRLCVVDHQHVTSSSSMAPEVLLWWYLQTLALSAHGRCTSCLDALYRQIRRGSGSY
jgi:hypothetical protein